jgi:tetratricopeptide (TPR) repeat protein
MRKSIALLLALMAASNIAQAMAQSADGSQGGSQQSDGSPGVSSPGSPGMEEEGEPAFKRELQKAKVHGLKSKEYAGALQDIGMFYNRQGRFTEANKALTEALAILDGNPALLRDTPRPNVPKRPDPPGVVSYEAEQTPLAYQVMSNLLPQLVTARTGAKQYASAEKVLQRWLKIAEAPQNPVWDKMFAYTQYAELLRKMGRLKDAQTYEQKAQAINSTIKGL